MDSLGRHAARLSGAMLGLVVAGCGAAQAGSTMAPVVLTRTDATLGTTVFATPPPTPRPPAGPLYDPALPLSAPPVSVPLEFRIPSLNVVTSVLAVGKTGRDLIDAPEGPADDPVWTKAFLFRGGARPGEPGVTTVIGHVDDTRARPDPFANIRLLHRGDIVELADQRSGEVMHYRITETRVVWNAAIHSTAALQELFGAGAVTQRAADKASDAASGVQRLTMMTCTGEWRGGGFDRRFFAFGVRDESAVPVAGT